MSTIIAKYVLTQKEVYHHSLEVIRALYPWLLRFVPLMGALFAVGLAYKWLVEERFLLGQIVPASVVAISFSTPVITWLESRHNFRRSPFANQEIVWRFDQEGLHYETEGAKGRFDWRRLVRFRVTGNGFLLFLNPRNAEWIPKTAFASPEDIEQFLRFARESGVKIDGRR